MIALAEHDDPRIRYGAAYALPNIMGSPPDPTGLAALRRLTLDPDEDVADWARLGLALSTGREIEDVSTDAGLRTSRGGVEESTGREVEDVGRDVLDP